MPQERWEDERQKLLSDLEVERNKSVEAQERSVIVIVTPWGHAVCVFFGKVQDILLP